MKIVIPDGDTLAIPEMKKRIQELFPKFGEVICSGTTNPEEVAQKIGDADVVLCNKTPITREVMNQCPNLKYIGLFATGYNNIDIPASKEKHITVCNAGAYSTHAVAQHTFALLLNLAGNITAYDNAVKAGDWERSPVFSYFPYPVHELYQKNFGIIGYGSIGKSVAKIAEAFGMHVLIHTRTKPENCPYELVSQEELFKKSDVISIHCPLTEQTENLICKKNLDLMKSSAYLINTARGGIVNEQDLADALNQDKIAGAGLDVLRQEPMSPDTPLKSAKNCLITSHMAWAATETRERALMTAFENLEAYLAGKPQNQVN